VQPLSPGGGADPTPDPPEGGAGDGAIDRRQFLRLGAVGAAGLVVATKHDKVTAHPKRHRARNQPAVVLANTPGGVAVPTAPWLIAENARPGTLNWICNHVQPDHALEGYASQVSAVPGDDVAVFVNTTARAVQVQAYRMGYYQGLGGRLVWQGDMVAAGTQGAPEVTPGIGTVRCPWSPTTTVRITNAWPPGCYLLKLVGSGGEEQFVPLTVRDDTSTAAYVLQNSVTTWQAYNLYGSYSLYYGPDGSGKSDFANRARVVSFDRPYPQTWASGAADFVGNELPLLFHLESLGLDLTYWTDVDLHVHPSRLSSHRCIFSLGHDEYWSRPMRDGAVEAVANGVNFAFLGANACYRQIRLQSTSVGANRLQVCYKDATEDPLAQEDPSLTTVNWNQAPVDQPESELIGSMYQSVGAMADMVVTDGSSWFFDGCDVSDGHVFPQVITGEYDRFVPYLPGPDNLDVLAHSPVPHQSNWSDVTYYTAPGGGGVFASGSASFVKMLSTTGRVPSLVIPGPFPGISDVFRRAMENLYGLFGLGPAGPYGSSGGNWSSIYSGASAGAASAAGTAAA
jgi:hypothetical protein